MPKKNDKDNVAFAIDLDELNINMQAMAESPEVAGEIGNRIRVWAQKQTKPIDRGQARAVLANIIYDVMSEALGTGTLDPS